MLNAWYKFLINLPLSKISNFLINIIPNYHGKNNAVRMFVMSILHFEIYYTLMKMFLTKALNI